MLLQEVYWGQCAGGLGNDEGLAIDATAVGTYATGAFEHDASTFQPFVLDSEGTHDVFTGRVNFGPTTAAPMPMAAPENVISLFSDSYTSVPVDTFRAAWSSAILQDITITGNSTKKYTALTTVGIETTGANLIDASAMQYLHIDVWTPNITTVRIKLLDFEANGLLGGGDDSEHELSFMPALRGWNSYDIPLSDFTGLTERAHIGQLILSSTPSGSGQLYIDNVYFRTGTLGTTQLSASTFRLYPNPANAVLNITADATIEAVAVFNLLGQQILMEKPLATSVVIDIAALQKGIYTVKVMLDSGMLTKKIIKE